MAWPSPNDRRPGRPCQLQRHSRRRLHDPEIAGVGKSEEEPRPRARVQGRQVPLYRQRSRARHADTDGFVKIIADAKTDRVLGVPYHRPGAGELIAEAVVLMDFGGSAEDLARTCHAHPTLSEAVKEAALAVDKRAIHV